MKRLALRLAATALTGASLLTLASTANAQSLRADCHQVDRETYVLKFYRETIRTGHQPAVLPLKRLLSDNCRISQQELQSINQVNVALQSFSRYSTVWVESNGYPTRAQYLYDSGRVERASFNLGYNGTPGRLQVMLQGDMDLARVRVKVGYYHPRPQPRPHPRPQPRPQPREKTFDVTCSSKDMNYAFCQAKGLVRAHLIRKLSDASCREGRSFWFTREGVHVDNGCRAIFRVTTR